MLLVHPESTCDVCLDAFSWATADKTPHAIGCGHVFCNACLTTLCPSTCPLCRRPFSRDRVRKLHVDRYEGSLAAAAQQEAKEAKELMERIALNSGEHSAREDVTNVLEEAKKWLDRDGHAATYPATYAAFTALIRYKALQEHHIDSQRQIEAIQVRLNHRQDELRTEKDKAFTVERHLLQKIEERDAEIEALRRQNARNDAETASRNPLPRPPQPYIYDYPSRETEEERNPYTRISVPTVRPRPYDPQDSSSTIYQPRAGVTYISGASYDERVLPERSPSREPEQRHRRRDGETAEQREARRERRRRRHSERAPVDDGEDTILIHGRILPGNALGIGASQATPTPRAPSAANYIYGPTPVPAASQGNSNANMTAGPSTYPNSLGLSNTPLYPPAQLEPEVDTDVYRSGLDDFTRMPGGLPADRGRRTGSPPQRVQPTPRSAVPSWSSSEVSLAQSSRNSSTSNFLSGLTGLSAAPGDELVFVDFPSAGEGQLLGVGLHGFQDTRSSYPTPREPPHVYRPTPSRASTTPSFALAPRTRSNGDQAPSAPSEPSRSRTTSISQASLPPNRSADQRYSYAGDFARPDQNASYTVPPQWQGGYAPAAWAPPVHTATPPNPGWPFAPGYHAPGSNPYGASATSLHSTRSGHHHH